MKKNRPESCGVGRLLFKAFVSVVLLLAASVSGAFAQSTIDVTGKVIDADGQPVVGASVVVAGTYTGTTTGADGGFALKAREGQELEVSFIGMSTQRVPVSAVPVTVTLESESTMIEQAVVIGYGTAKKRDLTGSIVNVDAATIANRPASNPLASLQGRVAGVQITNSGRAGQDPEIRIRGTNSINGFAPLYVVDGMFTDNINYLNANDIESFEILKDPSSLAIFGVRGANGVIIVTTKRAKMGQTVVNVNQSVGVKHVGHRMSLTNGPQFKELYNEQLSNMGGDPFDYTYYQANTDWQDAIFQNAMISQTTASIMGANEKSNFYLGVGYTYEQGSIVGEEMQKVTVNFSDEYKMKDWLKFGVQMNGAYMLPADAKNVTGAIHAAPISPIYDDATGGYYKLPSFQSSQISNPMIDIEEFAAHNKAHNYRFAGNVYGEINFLPELKFRAAFSIDYLSNNSRLFTPVKYEYDPDLANKSFINCFTAFVNTNCHFLSVCVVFSIIFHINYRFCTLFLFISISSFEIFPALYALSYSCNLSSFSFFLTAFQILRPSSISSFLTSSCVNTFGCLLTSFLPNSSITSLRVNSSFSFAISEYISTCNKRSPNSSFRLI